MRVDGFFGRVVGTIGSGIAIRVIGVVASVVIARYLGPDGKGVYAVVSLAASLLVYFSTLGLGQAATYYSGKNQYPRSDIAGHTAACGLVLSCLSIIVGCGVIHYFGRNLFPNVPKGILLGALFLIPAQHLFGFSASMLLGIGEVWQYNVMQIFRSVLLLFGSLLFIVLFEMGAWGALSADIASFAAAGAVSVIILHNKIGRPTFGRISEYGRDSFKYGLASFSGTTLSLLHSRVDMLLLAYLLPPAAVGIYSISVGLSEKLSILSDNISSVLFPRIAQERDPIVANRLTPLIVRGVLIALVPVVLIMLVLSRWVIAALYSDVYVDATSPFQVLLVGMVFMSVWTILDGDIKGRGKPIYCTATTLIALIANVVLNIVLIPKWGILGAAYASLGSYALACMCALAVYSHLSGISFAGILIPKKSDFRNFSDIITPYAQRLFGGGVAFKENVQ